MDGKELFQANLRMLQRRYSQYAELLTAIPDATGYSFMHVANSVLVRDVSGAWLHGPGDPWRDAAMSAGELVHDEPELYVVLRPGLGYQAFSLVDAVARRAPGSLVLVAEDRLDLFKAALAFMDWASVLTSSRAVLLLGDPRVTVELFLTSHVGTSMLPVALVAPPTGADGLDLPVLAERLESLSVGARRSMEGQLGWAAGQLAERRARQEPLKVLLGAAELGYLEKPLVDGFRSCGCTVDVQRDNRSIPSGLRAHDWISEIPQHTPDLVLWMNRPEMSQTAKEVLRDMGIASVHWSVDSPRRMRLTQDELNGVDVHLCFDSRYLRPEGFPLGRVSHQLSLGAGLAPLPQCEPSKASWPKRLGPAVSFIGALGLARLADVRASLGHISPDRLRLLEGLAEGSEDAERVFEEQTGEGYGGMACFYVDELRSVRRRTRFLSELPASLLRIFGGYEWADSPLSGCYAGHAAPYGFQLSSLYYHSHINVNVFHEQCIDSTNSRVYDVLAAGGFLLSEYRPAIEREFEIGRHLVTFTTPEEAREKAEYYLSHPSQREVIAREGQRHVLAHHTFAARCRTILELARPFIGRREVDAPAVPERPPAGPLHEAMLGAP